MWVKGEGKLQAKKTIGSFFWGGWCVAVMSRKSWAGSFALMTTLAVKSCVHRVSCFNTQVERIAFAMKSLKFHL